MALHGTEIARERAVERLARDLSRSADVTFDKRSNEVFLAAARVKIRETRSAITSIGVHVRKGSRATQSVEELLDNSFVIDGAMGELLDRWAKSYALRVPFSRDQEGRSFPRGYLLAKAFVRERGSRVDRASLELFLSTYQRLSPLSIRELDAFPDLLRFVLIEEIFLIAESTIRTFGEIDLAEEWFARIGKASRGKDISALTTLTAKLAARFQVIPVHFGFHLLQRITQSGKERDYRLITKWLKMTLARQGVGSTRLPETIARTQRDHVEVVRSAIASIRWLGQVRWERIANGLNAVDAILAKDPALAYENLDDFSRSLYRRSVIRIAERVGVHDVEVAKEALRLSRMSVDRRDLRKEGAAPLHVGYFLIDRGVLELERSVGYPSPLSERARRWLLRNATAVYLTTLAVLSIAGVALACTFFTSPITHWFVLTPLLFALLIVASEFASMVAHMVFTRLVPPRAIPSLDLSQGVGEKRRTIIAVPALFRDPAGHARLLRRMETNYLANRDPDIQFAALLDLSDADAETLSADAALIADVSHRIDELNHRYPSPRPTFLFLYRRRIWNSAEGVYMGWERKRGKLREFNQLLRGEETSFIQGPSMLAAETGRVHYVITLDEDTELARDGARKLIGTIDHPLNRPLIDPETRVVTRGFGIVEPRSAIRFSERGASLFSRLFGAYPGVEAYSALVSDLHLDLFGEGLFHGKGIYDIDAIETTMAGRIPESLVLSHDLLEGLYARVGIAPGAHIFEGFPSRFQEFSLRAHRWIRGDWQVVSWLFPPRSRGLSGIARWRLCDNLRRSIVAPAALLALVVGSYYAEVPLLWQVFILAIVGSGHIVSALVRSLDALFSLKRRFMLRYRIETTIVECSVAFLKVLLSAIFLLEHAIVALDAIGRALWRMTVSKKRLLEWRTAGDVAAGMRGSLAEVAVHMKFSLILPILAILAASAVGIAIPESLLFFAFAWTVAPVIAMLLGVRSTPRAVLPAHDQLFLRKIAARTTWYFSDMARPEFRGLVPDLMQEEPATKRHSHGLGISPTNLGMYLVSLSSAHALGVATLAQFSERAFRAIERVGRMERYRGHFLNWYEMEKLAPLEPRYVSSVDSANLALSLLAVRRTAIRALEEPVFAPVLLMGLEAELAIVEDECASIFASDLVRRIDRKLIMEIESAARSARELCVRVQSEPLSVDAAELMLTGVIHQTVRMRNALEALKIESEAELLSRVFVCVRNLESFVSDLRDTIDRYCSYARIPVVSATAEDASLRKKTAQLRGIFQKFPTIHDLASGRIRDRVASLCIAEEIDLSQLARPEKDRAHLWFREVLARLDTAEREARDTASRFTRVSLECRRYYDEMDFTFLYDEERGLFRGGYSVTRKELDEGVYDLLASEANSASIVAIARGDVPKKHWRYLGRKLVRSLRGDTLAISWAGSLFEYLGTLLFFDIPSESFWGVSAQRAIASHREFARRKRIPWGMGESASARLNVEQQHHYQAFGEQSIGLKRDLSKSIVVAPYTSALALTFSPLAAVANLRWLAQLGTLGVYGFYDAFDCTPVSGRVRASRGIPAKVYFAHHQGFIMASIGNALSQNFLRNALLEEAEMESITQLFEEQMPETVPADPLVLPLATPSVSLHRFEVSEIRRRYVPARAFRERSQFLSNGRYHVRITSAGAGSSAYEDMQLTREHYDALGESAGSFLYIYDRTRKSMWSPSYMPTRTAGEHSKTYFGESIAVFEKTFEGIRSTLSVTVHPTENIELRMIELVNTRSTPATLSIGSCAEISIAASRDEHAHGNYHQLFVRSEALSGRHAILASRKDPRDRTRVVVAGFAMVSDAPLRDVRLYRSREGFFGSSICRREPHALLFDTREAVLPEYTLDPAAGFATEITLAPNQTRKFAFVTIAASDRRTVEQKIREFSAFGKLARMMENAERMVPAFLSTIGISALQAETFSDLASIVEERRNVTRITHPEAVASQSVLWKCGISGERPIVLLRVSNASDLGAVRLMLLCATYFFTKGISADIVILNDHPGGYLKTFEDEVDFLVRTSGPQISGSSGNVFHVRSDQLDLSERAALLSGSAVSIDPRRGTLADQVRSMLQRPNMPLPPKFIATSPVRAWPPSPIVPNTHLDLACEMGGLDRVAMEYVISVDRDRRPPVPWANILTGETAGAMVTDRGMSFTWVGNSHEEKLTVAHTDALSRATAEAFYIRDEATGEFWSPQPIVGDPLASYTIRHGFGYSQFESAQGGLVLTLSLAIHPTEPAKLLAMSVRNVSGVARTLGAYGYFELLMGKTPYDTRPMLSFATLGDRALAVQQSFQGSYRERSLFVGMTEPIDTLTTSKEEFVGRFREIREPVALERMALSGVLVPNAEPCAAFQKTFSLAPGEVRVLTYVLGEASSPDAAAMTFARVATSHAYEDAKAAQKVFWDDMLSHVEVELPDVSSTALVGAWSQYQLISSRLRAKAGLAQISGAFGYRDQLQDALAMLWIDPIWVRKHILESARHQFVEGDVLSWWHPSSGFGARTRMSDPHLWLPYVVFRYLRATGDRAILDEQIPFLEGSAPLSGSRRVDANVFRVSETTGSLYEHLLRAIEHAVTSGAHGLPLILDADWNDGMNKVGNDGKGESVWLAMFFIDILDDAVELVGHMADPDRAARYRVLSEGYREAIRKHGWDGKWYRRAYTDDGIPLGASNGRSFAIDTVSQSWAMFSGLDRERSMAAVRETASMLRIWDGHVPLLAPALGSSSLDLGTISDYPPGVRENGSQYNHAALWFSSALALAGDPDLAKVAFDAVDPFLRSAKEGIAVYRGEPYAIAAEIYSAPTYSGRAGWTWYTASAGLYFRTAVETFLGLERSGDTLAIHPLLPSLWDGARVTLRRGQTAYHVTYRFQDDPSTSPAISVSHNGISADASRIPFVDDGALHEILVTIPRSVKSS